MHDVGLIIHGTTLATNALIERKGAVTALITTDGFRDAVEIGYEHRFEQYDIYLEKPAPLVPRHRRYTVPERMSARGEVLRPLDETAVEALIPSLRQEAASSVAVGLLHSYANPAHERRIRELLLAQLPQISVSLSSEVSPELREYERLSTVCANAYVQPLIAGYLDRLDRALRDAGFAGQLLLMTSGGGVIGLEAARRFPIRLVESGPAGGAILASHIALECGFEHVLSFDMGGTTAKICLIDGGRPQTSRAFEVARAYRFLKGSGLPLRIPVIEMVEIGAGGGSLARVDALERVTVGPDSAGAVPGPASYGQGGQAAAVTDADLVLGRIDPGAFAGGSLALDAGAATAAIERSIGKPLALSAEMAALAISEIVDENMASAARVHAVERGKSLDERTLVAYGGAAPLHASRVADKLGIARIVVPNRGGCGLRRRHARCAGGLRGRTEPLPARSRARPRPGQRPHRGDAGGGLCHRREERWRVPLVESRTAYMRYIGQGHEIAVPLEPRPLQLADRQRLQETFEREYRAQFERIIPGLEAEVLSWALTLRTRGEPPALVTQAPTKPAPAPSGQRRVFDPASGEFLETPVYRRADLKAGVRIEGPALIVEDETTTVVAPSFVVTVNAIGYLILERRRPS